ncbi:MAG: hypothetical protein CR972_00975 [Candidatus Moraniibacteriota bacterium]|nr:MAG: hypothetical protein CR972_00975 [Candidatus Moranbacteria bacterium]
MTSAGSNNAQVSGFFEKVEGKGKKPFKDSINPPGPTGDEHIPSWMKDLDVIDNRENEVNQEEKE